MSAINKELQAQFSHLSLVCPNNGSKKDVAANIRAHYKKTFPKAKFQVRMTGSGIEVNWVDGVNR